MSDGLPIIILATATTRSLMDSHASITASKSHYETLSIDKGANEEEIKRAYRKVCMHACSPGSQSIIHHRHLRSSRSSFTPTRTRRPAPTRLLQVSHTVLRVI